MLNKVWYENIGDVYPILIGPAEWDRPDNPNYFVVDIPLHVDVDQFIIGWDEDVPYLSIDPEYADRKSARDKAKMWEAIKSERDRRKSGGFKVGDKWFHSDVQSRLQHLGLLILGESVPAINWKTMDKTFVTLNHGIVQQVFQSALNLDVALHNKAEEHKAAMESSPNPLSYDFSTGWPESYGI